VYPRSAVNRIAKAITLGGLLAVSLALSGCGSSTSNSSGASSSSGAPEPTDNIYVVKSKSFCAVTGVSDVYTGNGKVEFFYVLHNSGGKEGSIDLQPIRHYDDGTTNDSPVDESQDNKVPAGQTVKLHTDQFSYKAHEHEIVGCAVKAGDTEVPLRVVHL
jgi:hypothetical protein